MSAAEWFVHLLTAYSLAGLVFAAAFVTRLVERLDPAAKGSGWGFRLIVFPGAAALWPVLLAHIVRKAV
jgi:hypothetical protein